MGMLSKAKKHKKHEAPKTSPANEVGDGAQDDDGEQLDGASSDGASEAPDQQPPDNGASAVEAPPAAAGDEPQDAQGDSDEQSGVPQDQNGQEGPPGGDVQEGDESGQGDSPDEGGDQDDTSAPGSGQDGHIDLSKVPISPALMEEFKRCNAALMTALYTNDAVAQHVMAGIAPQGPRKIESAARMATLLVTQINKQLHFIQDTPQVVLPFTKDVVSHVLDLTQQVKKIQWSEQEANAVLGTALEIMLRTCGVNKKQMGALRHCIPRSQIMAGLDQYHQHLAAVKGATGQGPEGTTPAGSQAPPGSPPSANEEPAQAGGAGADPADQAQVQPQPGTPVTAAPGPGQSAPPGGMLSAAQAPEQGTQP